MNNTFDITEKRINSLEQKEIIGGLNFHKCFIHIIMGFAASFGVWGITCFINALICSNSLQEISRGIMKAITGI